MANGPPKGIMSRHHLEGDSFGSLNSPLYFEALVGFKLFVNSVAAAVKASCKGKLHLTEMKRNIKYTHILILREQVPHHY